ncbi:hypothetical protein BaRGS_00010197 [Batillaria attramentaria]|uniref:MFS transporter n=1 Tax=Batillaria attramentaria TaxID=370345 RepID=A0ABD0LHM2_9CAEN
MPVSKEIMISLEKNSYGVYRRNTSGDVYERRPISRRRMETEAITTKALTAVADETFVATLKAAVFQSALAIPLMIIYFQPALDLFGISRTAAGMLS